MPCTRGQAWKVCGEGLFGAQVRPDEWEWVSVGYLHIAVLSRTKEMGTPSSGCSWQRGVSRFQPNLHSCAAGFCAVCACVRARHKLQPFSLH